MKRFSCRHEEWCSRAGAYWHYRSPVEILDDYGAIIEVVEDTKPVYDAACTECGAGAVLKEVKIPGKEVVAQGALGI